MEIIHVGNRKGGVGKTTMAANIAAGLAIQGKRIGLIDTDPQGHLARAFGYRAADNLHDAIEARQKVGHDADAQKGLLPQYIWEIPQDKYSTPDDGGGGALFLIPDAEKTALIPQMLDAQDLGVFYELAHDFGDLCDLDALILDTSPTLNELDSYITMAVDKYVLPFIPEDWAIDGLEASYRSIKRTARKRQSFWKTDTGIIGIVPSMFQVSTLAHRDALGVTKKAFDGMGVATLPTVRRSVIWAEAAAAGESIFRYEPTGKQAQQMQKVVDSVMERIEWHVNA